MAPTTAPISRFKLECRRRISSSTPPSPRPAPKTAAFIADIPKGRKGYAAAAASSTKLTRKTARSNQPHFSPAESLPGAGGGSARTRFEGRSGGGAWGRSRRTPPWVSRFRSASFYECGISPFEEYTPREEPLQGLGRSKPRVTSESCAHGPRGLERP